jgi:GNAT superfamily N-acetyltransferase
MTAIRPPVINPMAMLRIQRTTSEHPDFGLLVKQLDAHLWEMYPETQALYDTFNVIEENKTVVIAYRDDEPVGCGCFKQVNAETAELKRMFVRADARGKGVSHLIMDALEQWATEAGYRYLVLETMHKQIPAISLYQKRGFIRIENYEPYVGLTNSLCMRKEI